MRGRIALSRDRRRVAPHPAAASSGIIGCLEPQHQSPRSAMDARRIGLQAFRGFASSLALIPASNRPHHRAGPGRVTAGGFASCRPLSAKATVVSPAMKACPPGPTSLVVKTRRSGPTISRTDPVIAVSAPSVARMTNRRRRASRRRVGEALWLPPSRQVLCIGPRLEHGSSRGAPMMRVMTSSRSEV
jgi:hypothetical protein